MYGILLVLAFLILMVTYPEYDVIVNKNRAMEQ